MTVFKLFVLYVEFFLVCYMACYVFFVILLLILIKFVLLIVASSISLNIRVVSLYYFLCELGFSVGYCRRLRHNRTFSVRVLSCVLGTTVKVKGHSATSLYRQIKRVYTNARRNRKSIYKFCTRQKFFVWKREVLM